MNRAMKKLSGLLIGMVIILTAAPRGIAGPAGNALDFDGIDDTVTIPAAATLELDNTLTIELWVYPTDLSTRQGIFSTRSANAEGSFQIEVGPGGGTNRVAVTGISTFVVQTDDNAIAPGQWSHIAYIRSATGPGNQKLYVNGIEQTLLSEADYAFLSNSDAKVIASGTNGDQLFTGRIDELRVWNEARTEADIRDNMGSELTGTESGLVAYYAFNESVGATLPDRTANGNDGTLNGMTDGSWVASTAPLDADFGDALEPYPTLLSDNGAYHSATGPTLGASRDMEPDGAPSAAADGDGADEDGVTFGRLQIGKTDCPIIVNVQGGSAKLDAWIDWDGDGCWGGAWEQVADHVSVTTGDNALSIDVPNWVVKTDTYARFRLSTAGDLGVIGPAGDGEVEDYRVSLVPAAPGANVFAEQTLASGQDVNYINRLAAGDLDGDGDTDLVFGTFMGADFAWLENDGNADPGFAVHSFIPGVFSLAIALADLDGDGDLDIVAGLYGGTPNKFAWLENDGAADPSFSMNVIADLSGVALGVCAADMDGDGDLDVVGSSEHGVFWYVNDGTQGFTESHVVSTKNANLNADCLAVPDMDGDGDMDVLVYEASTVAWYENTDPAMGTFTRHLILDASTYGAVSSVDMDGDGDMDVVHGSNGHRMAWSENDGEGNFTFHTLGGDAADLMTVDDRVWSVCAADVDADGDADILAAVETDGYWLRLYENDGAQNFTTRTLREGAGIHCVIAADVDGDGDLDAVAADELGKRLFWYEQADASVLTAPTTNIMDSSADGGGEVVYDYGATVTARGVCWNTTGDPTIADTHTSDGTGPGAFTSSLTGLSGGGHTYFVRAYATTDEPATRYGTVKVIATAMAGAGNALAFNGSNAYVNVGNDLRLNDLDDPLTIEAWIRPDALTERGAIFSTRGQNEYGSFQLEVGPGSGGVNRVAVSANDSGTEIWLAESGDNAIVTDRWTHIAYVRDGGSQAIYINGASRSLVTTNTYTIVDNDTDKTIGCGTSGGWHFAGVVDNLRIWNTALTAAQLVVSMGSRLVGDESALLAAYRFDHLDGTALHELTGAGDGTVVGGDWVNSPVAIDPDFGDAPAPYPVTVAENGARHGTTGPTLGASRDTESDGSHSVLADGDGTDDDDGVSGWTHVQVSKLGASVTVNVQGGPARLDAWVDWNRDGCWAGLDERIAAGLDVVNGDNVVGFDVPYWAHAGDTYARFRLSSAGNLPVSGIAADGEIEDHLVTIQSPSSGSGSFKPGVVVVSNFAFLDSTRAGFFAADVNQDGALDLLTAGANGADWHEQTGGVFVSHHLADGAPAAQIYATDIDADGDIDILGNGVGIIVFRNDGTQQFVKQNWAASWTISQFGLGDIDGDGDLDALGEDYGDGIRWGKNSGGGVFDSFGTLYDTGYCQRMSCLDVNRDGNIDMLSQAGFSDYAPVRWIENRGNLHFVTHVLTSSLGEGLGTSGRDLDQDGDMDLMAAIPSADTIVWYRNDGSQNFTEIVVDDALDGARSVCAADLDGDGDEDLLATAYNDDMVVWYENDGDQNFTRHLISDAADGADMVIAADVDGDGDLDVLSASRNDNRIAWYEQSGPTPWLTTAAVTNITATAADGGGEVTNEGASAVTTRGVCWNTTGHPTLADNHTTDGAGPGAFTSAITGLTEGLTYYVRAYATNTQGTAYGEERIFTTTMTPPGNALDFDGVDDYAVADSVCADIAGGAFTMEAWVYPRDSEPGQDVLFSCHTSAGGNRFFVAYRDGGVFSFYDATCEYTDSVGTFTAARWHHVALSIGAGGSGTLYVNGVSQAGVVNTDGPLGDGRFSLGQEWDGSTKPSDFFNGEMDEVRVWNAARSEAEIQDNMHRELNGDEAGLVAYYALNQSNTGGLDDLTVNGNDGTLRNMDISTAWVAGSFPCANAIADAGNLRGVWDVNTTSLASGRFRVADAMIAAPDFALFGHDSGSDDWQTADVPGGVEKRLGRVWQLEVSGNVGDDLVIDTSGLSDIGDGSKLRLLRDADGIFADATLLSGSYVGNFFTVADQTLTDGVHYTLGVLADGGEITGDVDYGWGQRRARGEQLGAVIVQAAADAAFTQIAGQTMPGTAARGGLWTYTIGGLAVGDYYVRAFVDSDGNGVPDVAEAYGTYPGNPVTVGAASVTGIDVTLTDPDTDQDFLPDWWEVCWFDTITATTGGDDPDSDLDTNLTEYNNGTDPTDPQSGQAPYDDYDFEIYQVGQGSTGRGNEREMVLPSSWGSELTCWAPEGWNITGGTLTKPGIGFRGDAIPLDVAPDGSVATWGASFASLVTLLFDMVPGIYVVALDLVSTGGRETGHLETGIPMAQYSGTDFPGFVTVQIEGGPGNVPTTPLLEFDTDQWDFLRIIDVTGGTDDIVYEYRQQAGSLSSSHRVPADAGLVIGRTYELVVDQNDEGGTRLGSRTLESFTPARAGTNTGAPTATPYRCLTVEAGSSVSIQLEGSDPDAGAILTFAIEDDPAAGTLTGFDAAAGTVIYTPTVRHTGTDSFTFSASDGELTSEPAEIMIYTVGTDMAGWLVAIEVSGASVGCVQFGVEPGALDEVDQGFDLLAPPSPPPTGLAEVAFIAQDGSDLLMQRDVRAGTDGDWVLEITAADTSVVLSWAPATVPDIGLLLTEVEDPGRGRSASYNMAETSQLMVPAGVTRQFVISTADTCMLELALGWNLISLPIEPLDPAVSAIFVDSAVQDGRGASGSERGSILVGAVYEWDAGDLVYRSVTQLEPLKGYWVHVNQLSAARGNGASAVLIVHGTAITEPSWSLSRGWNLVGPPEQMDLPGWEGLFAPAWWWDGTTYQSAPTLYPGRGYWIYMSSAMEADLSR